MTSNQVDHAEDWKHTLQRLLPLWGHRNWIVIADSAYPAQSNPGILTLATGADHFLLLKTTIDAIDNSSHMRAKLYLDSEFKLVTEQDGPGSTLYRQTLTRLIEDRGSQTLPHDAIIAKLDESAKQFRVLILKSTLTIPYASVFIELECGYWTSEAEERLRISESKRSR